MKSLTDRRLNRQTKYGKDNNVNIVDIDNMGDTMEITATHCNY